MTLQRPAATVKPTNNRLAADEYGFLPSAHLAQRTVELLRARRIMSTSY